MTYSDRGLRIVLQIVFVGGVKNIRLWEKKPNFLQKKGAAFLKATPFGGTALYHSENTFLRAIFCYFVTVTE